MEENKELTKSIDKLTKATRRSNNLGWMILKGIFYSFGWVIGLAILAVFAYYVLPKISEGNVIGRFVHAIINIIRKNQY